MNWDGMIKSMRERRRLARLLEAGAISEDAYERGLVLMKPPQNHKRAFSLLLTALGSLQLLAGVVFFFAHNWIQMDRFLKLGLIETAILVCLAAAWRKGINTTTGVWLLFASSSLTGILFAVFGQIYQTGADAYTLFANWAGLSFAAVVVARSRLLWVQWFVIVITALFLFWSQLAHPFWGWSDMAAWSVAAGIFAVALVWVQAEHRGLAPTSGLSGLSNLWWAAMLGFLIAPNMRLIDMAGNPDTATQVIATLVGVGMTLAALGWSLLGDTKPGGDFARLNLSAYYLLFITMYALHELVLDPLGMSEIELLLTGLIILGSMTFVNKKLAGIKDRILEVPHD